MPSIAEINLLDCAAFTSALGHVFEHSPWIAAETWPRRPFRDAAHLHAEMCATLRKAPRERQLGLVRAHPDLAGRLAHEDKLTRESAREQESAGLNRLTDAERASFRELNESYRARFDFPFVICARLNAKDAILAAMRKRLDNPPQVELAAALAEIEKIAKLRLAEAVNE